MESQPPPPPTTASTTTTTDPSPSPSQPSPSQAPPSSSLSLPPPQSQHQQQQHQQQQHQQHQQQQQQQSQQQQQQQQQQSQQQQQQQPPPPSPSHPNVNHANSYNRGGVPLNNRPPGWPQQYTHFSSQFHSSSSSSTSTSLSSSATTFPKSGIAIGVPAPPHQPSAAASFTVHYGGAIPRSSVTVSDPSSVRTPIHGMSSMGMIGTQIRPGGVAPSAIHQQRSIQAAPGIRPQTTSSNLPSVPQNFQGQGMLRASSVTPPSTSTPSTSQSQQPPHQPWLSTPQGRPPLPSHSFRPQVNSQSLQQRSHIPQQSTQPVQAASQPHQLLPSPQQQQFLSPQQQQFVSSQQQQQHFSVSNQSQENYGQQLTSSRVSQPSANQQTVRVQGSANQRPLSPAMGQAVPVHSGLIENTNAMEISEPCSTILSKRSIQELVNQIDPSEKLDPDVEDVLVDIAEDFIDSVTTFGCSLAKHRKSNTLEAKDILLHLERTWNMTLPGYTGDEIKTYKKPVVNDVHKERLALIKKSHAVADHKTSAGPTTGNVKGHLAKATPSVVGS